MRKSFFFSPDRQFFPPYQGIFSRIRWLICQHFEISSPHPGSADLLIGSASKISGSVDSLIGSGLRKVVTKANFNGLAPDGGCPPPPPKSGKLKIIVVFHIHVEGQDIFRFSYFQGVLGSKFYTFSH